jgi:hypothetical protein
MTWQPIETAPKDGTNVLLLLASGRRTVGGWEAQKYYLKPVPYWRTEFGYLAGVKWDRDNQPTHWMPLPDPPAARARQMREGA